MSKITQRIAYTAVLTAISVVLNMGTFNAGIKHFALSFVYIPCFIAGYKLKLFDAFLVGFLGDLIAGIIHPLGPYLPLIGIGSGLLGLIPALVFKFSPFGKIANTILSFFLVLVLVTAGINTFALWLAFSKGATFFAYLGARAPFQSLVLALNTIIALLLLPSIDRVIKTKLN